MASTIKVDNVQNQPGTNIIDKCGTTITLGQSGDTIALACGASQTGFGRTGTVDWVTSPQTGTVTGATGKGYFVDTTSGGITVNLPAGAAGSIVSVADYAATWNTNNVTVSPNGSEKIGGVNANVTLDVKGQSVTFVYIDSTQGWINTMDSTSDVRASTLVAATGGTPPTGAIVCTDYKVHSFTSPGTLCVSAGAGPLAVIDYLVIAGGGSGGGARPDGAPAPGTSPCRGGGGGAGGFRESDGTATGSYCASPLGSGASALNVTVQGYPITVGAGGANPNGPQCEPGTSGSNSIFSTITSTAGGGGGGATGGPQCSPFTGQTGGSGGGAMSQHGSGLKTGAAGNTPPFSPPQGKNGGSSCGAPNPGNAGAGGGAAITVGSDTVVCAGGAGGAGATTCISATPTSYAGGGGGGSFPNSGAGGAGGAGGGGTGQSGPYTPGVISTTSGTTNTGSGGGGGGRGTLGSGGSGIVIIRYKFQ